MSPRPGPRRTAVTVRLKTEAVAYVDALAATEQSTRSEMIRRLLGEAAAHRRRRGQVAGLAVAARAAADWETATLGVTPRY
jgi:metal-responsive CopG/Arc/MetJ family transcriptional regulator